jgi:hypothetical protein
VKEQVGLLAVGLCLCRDHCLELRATAMSEMVKLKDLILLLSLVGGCGRLLLVTALEVLQPEHLVLRGCLGMILEHPKEFLGV